jgi:hypothetical protein
MIRTNVVAHAGCANSWRGLNLDHRVDDSDGSGNLRSSSGGNKSNDIGRTSDDGDLGDVDNWLHSADDAVWVRLVEVARRAVLPSRVSRLRSSMSCSARAAMEPRLTRVIGVGAANSGL